MNTVIFAQRMTPNSRTAGGSHLNRAIHQKTQHTILPLASHEGERGLTATKADSTRTKDPETSNIKRFNVLAARPERVKKAEMGGAGGKSTPPEELLPPAKPALFRAMLRLRSAATPPLLGGTNPAQSARRIDRKPRSGCRKSLTGGHAPHTTPLGEEAPGAPDFQISILCTVFFLKMFFLLRFPA